MDALNKTIITLYNKKYVIITLIDGIMQDISVLNDLYEMPIGTIVNARITQNVKNIDSSFLQYSPKGIGFINKSIKCESVIPVIYKKEPSLNKKALFSDTLSISGDLCVVSEGGGSIRISSKVAPQINEDIRTALKMSFPKLKHDIIVRTKSAGLGGDFTPLILQAEEFISRLLSIRENAASRPQYTCFYKPESELIKTVNDAILLGSKEIVTDDAKVYNLLKEAGDNFNIRLYEDSLLPLCKLYSFDAKISEVTSRKVYLKSGAYITIDHTEALTAIDVNSAKSPLLKLTKEEAFYKINCEAAVEIARQIRLRNISGNILIDFINMKSEKSYDMLNKVIIDELKKDNVQVAFYGFTKLRLAEIARQRKRISLYESLKSDTPESPTDFEEF